ncbi:MAG: hypothetical protein ACRDTX_31840, partial [Pseudonocardiaceae bacterium]
MAGWVVELGGADFAPGAAGSPGGRAGDLGADGAGHRGGDTGGCTGHGQRGPRASGCDGAFDHCPDDQPDFPHRVTRTASCPTGTLVGGGGYLRNVADPATLPTNGLVLGGTNPST